MRNQGLPPEYSPIEPLQWIVTPLWRGALYLSPTHLVIKLILTSKAEPPPKRLHNLRGHFLRTGRIQEQGALLLTLGILHIQLFSHPRGMCTDGATICACLSMGSHVTFGRFLRAMLREEALATTTGTITTEEQCKGSGHCSLGARAMDGCLKL